MFSLPVVGNTVTLHFLLLHYDSIYKLYTAKDLGGKTKWVSERGNYVAIFAFLYMGVVQTHTVHVCVWVNKDVFVAKRDSKTVDENNVDVLTPLNPSASKDKQKQHNTVALIELNQNNNLLYFFLNHLTPMLVWMYF